MSVLAAPPRRPQMFPQQGMQMQPGMQPGMPPMQGGLPPQMPPAMPQPQPAPQPQPDVEQAQATHQAEELLSSEEFRKLKERVASSFKQLEPQRNARTKAKKQYVADTMGASGLDNQYEAVVNMMDQMVEVYMQQLVSGNPQCLVLTEKIAQKTSARYFQMALNHVLKNIGFRDSLKYAILESLFSMAIMKVGVDVPDYTERAYPFDVSAMPWVEPIFFSSWVHDTSVDRWELCRFYGDRYKEHRDTLAADPRNDQSVLALATGDGAPSGFDTGEMDNENKLKGPSAYSGDEEKEFVTLWDIYLPRQRLLVTYIADGAGEKPLRVVRWNGPPTGPYIIGRYKLVPDEILPKPPVQDIRGLADLHNKMWLKMGEQASRQKTVGFAPIAAVKDAQKVIRASDGDVIAVTNPEAIKEWTTGGVRQEMLTFAQVVKNEASYGAGNLDTMGGLASQAGTLGQEQLLSAGSSGRIRSRQQTVVELTKEACYAVGWYIWNDPLVRISVTDKIPDTDVEVEMRWPIQENEYGQEIDMRQGEYNDYNFDIEPFSMQDKAPGERAQLIRSVWAQDIMPAMPLLVQQGITVDLMAYLEMLESYLGIKELAGIVKKLDAPPDAESQPVNLGGTKPPSTTRQYDRVVGGKSGDGSAELIGGMSKAASPTGVR